MKEKLLVSACLLGVGCRYDGLSRPNVEVISLSQEYELVPFCPEIYGGLPTPRTPSEIVGDRVVMKDGRDVTAEYSRGATEAVCLCKLLGIKKACLKANSPSCGAGQIYDGTFSGILVEGDGITTRALVEGGVFVVNEEEVARLKTKE